MHSRRTLTYPLSMVRVSNRTVADPIVAAGDASKFPARPEAGLGLGKAAAKLRLDLSVVVRNSFVTDDQRRLSVYLAKGGFCGESWHLHHDASPFSFVSTVVVVGHLTDQERELIGHVDANKVLLSDIRCPVSQSNDHIDDLADARKA